MRKIAGLLVALAFAAGGALPALARIEYSDPVTPDPVQDNGVYFDPAAATAGTAIAGLTLNSIAADAAGNDKNCTTRNPCALATPALDELPPALRQSEHKASALR